MKKTPKHLKDNLSPQFDVVIVGSGPAGVSAAYPLVKAGLQVAIIDGGLDSKRQDPKTLDFSDVSFSAIGHEYDLIRKSSYVFNKTYQLLKIKSKIEIIQSLAKGGLSEVWDGICDYFSKAELERIGLLAEEIQKEYQEVASLMKLKTRMQLDLHGQLLLQAAKKRVDLKDIVYQLPSAFSYRTRAVVEDLKRFKNFTYIPNQLVFNIKDKSGYVEIQSFSIDRLVDSITRAGFLILAAGSVNSTRILLRSLNLLNHKTTFLTKAHSLTVCLNLKTLLRSNILQSNKLDLLKRTTLKKLHFGQIALISNETNQGLGTFFVQLYQLNPQTLHKTLKYIPLPKIVALKILSKLVSSLVVADIRFPAFESKNKFCKLKKDNNGKDVLKIFFHENSTESGNHKYGLRKIMRQLLSLGLIPLKTVSDYATSHYAGGIPFQRIPGKLSVDANCKLHQANRIYVADSSTWRALPAKPPTLTIMANASRVGKNVLKKFH